MPREHSPILFEQLSRIPLARREISTPMGLQVFQI
jgi:hypothetical protein